MHKKMHGLFAFYGYVFPPNSQKQQEKHERKQLANMPKTAVKQPLNSFTGVT